MGFGVNDKGRLDHTRSEVVNKVGLSKGISPVVSSVSPSATTGLDQVVEALKGDACCEYVDVTSYGWIGKK